MAGINWLLCLPPSPGILHIVFLRVPQLFFTGFIKACSAGSLVQLLHLLQIFYNFCLIASAAVSMLLNPNK